MSEMRYQPGEPVRRARELRARVAADELTEAEAADELFTWDQRVGWAVTREGAAQYVAENHVEPSF